MRQMRQEMGQMRQGMRQGMRQIICLICLICFIGCLICLIVLIPCLILGFICQIGCTDHCKHIGHRKPGYFHLYVNAAPGLCWEMAFILKTWLRLWVRDESELGLIDGYKRQLEELTPPWRCRPESSLNIQQMQQVVQCFTKERPAATAARTKYFAVVIRGKKMGRIRQAYVCRCFLGKLPHHGVNPSTNTLCMVDGPAQNFPCR